MTFEDLEVWQKARQLVNEVYKVTSFPSLEKNFGLINQLQRAAVSTMSNLAEGFERVHVTEKLQFYNIARASNAEVRSLLYVIRDNYPALSVDAEQLQGQSNQLGRLISGFIAATQRRRTIPR